MLTLAVFPGSNREWEGEQQGWPKSNRTPSVSCDQHILCAKFLQSLCKAEIAGTAKQVAALEAENWHTGSYASLIPSATLYQRTYCGFLIFYFYLKNCSCFDRVCNLPFLVTERLQKHLTSILSLSLLVLDNARFRKAMIFQITVVYTDLTGHCSTSH